MAKKKSKSYLGKILLWIFFLPFMAIIAIWKTKKLKIGMKAGLTAILFFVFLLAGIFGETDEGNVPQIESPSYSSSSVSSIVEIEQSSSSSSSSEISIAPVDETSSEPEAENIVESSSQSEPYSEEQQNSVPDNSTFEIHFIDVGQADAALIECDGEYMLIDGGNVADSDKMYSVLKNAGASHLEILVGTHAHEDHIGGLAGALNYATADVTLCPVKSYDSKAFNNFKKYADLNGGGITVPSVGDTYSLGRSIVTIVGVNGGSDTNDTSIILKIEYGETSFLFTGDAEWEAENAATYSSYDLSATVLKVGHHGSDTSTGYVFLRSVMPEYAVISVGKGNSYGHPHDDPLSRLRDADVKVFRTDLQGDIYCTSDGETVTFTVEKNASADTLAPGVIETPKPSSSAAPKPPASSSSSSEQEETTGGDVYDFVLNKNSKKFHYDWCGSVKKMKDSNKKFVTGTRDEVISMGYDPCNNCNP